MATMTASGSKRPSLNVHARVATSPSPTTSTTDPLHTSRFYAYPPSWTLQPNMATRGSQLASWSGLIQRWCAYKRTFRLVVADALDSPLFYNAAIGRRLNHTEALAVLEFMVSGRVTPVGSSTSTAAAAAAAVDAGKNFEQRAEWTTPEKTALWIYWRRPEEWAELIADWVDATGQKGVVLTLYELTEGEGTTMQDFYGMPEELLKKVLQVLVKRGKAQVFGTSGEQGVKFS